MKVKSGSPGRDPHRAHARSSRAALGDVRGGRDEISRASISADRRAAPSPCSTTSRALSPLLHSRCLVPDPSLPPVRQNARRSALPWRKVERCTGREEQPRVPALLPPRSERDGESPRRRLQHRVQAGASEAAADVRQRPAPYMRRQHARPDPPPAKAAGPSACAEPHRRGSPAARLPPIPARPDGPASARAGRGSSRASGRAARTPANASRSTTSSPARWSPRRASARRVRNAATGSLGRHRAHSARRRCRTAGPRARGSAIRPLRRARPAGPRRRRRSRRRRRRWHSQERGGGARASAAGRFRGDRRRRRWPRTTPRAGGAGGELGPEVELGEHEEVGAERVEQAGSRAGQIVRQRSPPRRRCSRRASGCG